MLGRQVDRIGFVTAPQRGVLDVLAPFLREFEGPGLLVIVGAGVGLALTLTTDAVVSAVPADKAGAASAVSETAYELGAALGIAVLGTVLSAWAATGTFTEAIQGHGGVAGRGLVRGLPAHSGRFAAASRSCKRSLTWSGV